MKEVMLFKNEIKKGILIRAVEQKLLDLFSRGKLNGTVHTCVGQELSGVFISKHLNKGDHVVSNHRGHGHYLSRYTDIKGLIGEVMGKEVGCSGGYGGSQHLFNDNFLSNGIQGGMLPIAAGISLFYKQNNINNISLAYIGDGTLGEGILYETMNIVSKWSLPFLIVMENNFYAQSTSINQSFAGDLKKRVEGFGFNYSKTNTYDLNDLNSNVKNIIQSVRDDSNPGFIEIETYRLNAHSKGDDNRNEDEINNFKNKDIISKVLEKNIAGMQEYYKIIRTTIDEIVSDLENEKNLENSKRIEFDSKNYNKTGVNPLLIEGRYNKLINNALNKFLKENNNSIILGEDIQDGNEHTPKMYGGAFKVTKNLSKIYPKRVFNTPISEAAIVGIGAGYSIKAGRTFVEIMFGDFTTLIFDQILQHLTKFELMYNGQISCPIVIRTPMGGKRGYGPTHSQSIEKHFLGIPNLLVLALNHRISPDYVFTSIKNLPKKPILLIENKILYTIDAKEKKIEGYKYNFQNTNFPTLKIVPIIGDPIITIICYGEVLRDLELAARRSLIELELLVDIVCPLQISPVDISYIIDSLKRTKNLIIIEEGNTEAAWGSEVIAKLVEQNSVINKLVRFGNNGIIPSSIIAENKVLPTEENIFNIISSF